MLIIIFLLFLLSGCASTTWQQNQKAIIGGVGGAAAGRLIASAFDANTAGMVSGALLGGLIVGSVGNHIDAADRQEAIPRRAVCIGEKSFRDRNKVANPG